MWMREICCGRLGMIFCMFVWYLDWGVRLVNFQLIFVCIEFKGICKECVYIYVF